MRAAPYIKKKKKKQNQQKKKLSHTKSQDNVDTKLEKKNSLLSLLAAYKLISCPEMVSREALPLTKEGTSGQNHQTPPI